MNNIKKSLLYIVTQAEWGGAQRYIFDLATNLTGEYDITVATGRPDKEHQELIEDIKDIKDIKILSFKHLIREINPYHDILAVFEIAKFLRQNHFDIIHLNSSKAGVIGALATWLTKKTTTTPPQLTLNPSSINPKSTLNPKILYTAHGWVYLEPLPFWRRWIYLWMEKLAAKLRDATIVLSEKEKEVALRYKTAKKKSIYIIPNGINLETLNFLSKEKARKILRILDIKDIVIGTITNLYKTKGLDFLIEAIKILNIQYPCLAGRQAISNIKVIIIGDGPEKENLKSKIKNLKLEGNVFLAGSIPEAWKYLKAFDIFVLPSIKEGFPYTILEAMAAGLPIVATGVGGVPEMIENQKSGLVVPAANSQKLAEAILDLINHPDKARELGQEARKRVTEKFPLAGMIEKTRMVYAFGGL